MKKKEPSTKRTHIVKRDTGWAVKKEGSQRASRIYVTKEKAVKSAVRSSSRGSDVVIHKEDGSIQKWVKSKKK